MSPPAVQGSRREWDGGRHRRTTIRCRPHKGAPQPLGGPKLGTSGPEGPPRGQDPRVLELGPVLPVCVRAEVEVAAPDRDRERPWVDLVRVDWVRVDCVRVDRVRVRGASPRPPDTATLDNGLPPRPAAGRPVATRVAAPAPETTVFIPPRIARAPNDTPAPAALPPISTPVPTADPTVRTAVSVGFFTIWGALSCQTRAPYPATAPRNPATNHSSTCTAPSGRSWMLHPAASHLIARPPVRHHPDRRKPPRRVAGSSSVGGCCRRAGGVLRAGPGAVLAGAIPGGAAAPDRGAARSGSVGILAHAAGGRDRRHYPLCDRPQDIRLGGTDPAGAQLRPHRPPRPHHQAGLGGGALGAHRSCPAGQDPAAVHPLLCPVPTAAAPRSPPSRSRASCSPALSTSSTRSRPRPPPAEKVSPPGALASQHAPATRPSP
jgi:hypothetical protein